MPSSKKTIGAPHLMLPVMVASSMMQVMWSSTPATNSDKKDEEEGEKEAGEEAKPCDQGQHQMQQSFNVDHTSCAAFVLCVR